ncbi:MAG: ATP-binding cassette domain-containing protein [Elusimicrobia bacterium]|nr:ATP-binding cassette domain-containing protein [Candidatus Obscuribacterium magneticum]
MNLDIERGQKIALVGPNGAGKSTLLKLLAGEIPFQSGERKLGHNAQVGYFSQHRSENFPGGGTVYQVAAATPRPHSETTIRTVLGSFLFRGEAVYKSVDVLSGGEKSRLGLVRLLLDPRTFFSWTNPPRIWTWPASIFCFRRLNPSRERFVLSATTSTSSDNSPTMLFM